MTVAFSTSSPVASIAVFDGDGRVVYAAERSALGAASGACLAMLVEAEIDPAGVGLWLADVGPGSFTGTRVGVVLAKTFAWTHGARCAGADAFDLIDPGETVAIPNRRNEWLVRVPGEAARVVPAESMVAIGYAPELAEKRFPHAAAFAPLLPSLAPVDPQRLVAVPVVAPSISTPKRPLSRTEAV